MEIDWSEKRIQRYLVLATALSFLLLTVAVICLYYDPTTGYEYSVYESTPLIFWIAITVCLMNGILIFMVFYSRNRVMWGVGLFEIILAHFALVSLYLYRGFMYLQKADSLSYIGYAKDILLLDHIPGSNYYPMGSLIMVSTGEIIGQSMILISQMLPAIFTIAYTLGLLCWSRTLSTSPRFVTSMMLASTPILFAWFLPSIFYQTLFVLMMPLFFFMLWRMNTSDIRMKVLVMMMFILFTLGHPLVAIGVLVSYVNLLGTRFVLKTKPKVVTLPILVISILVFIFWVSTNVLLMRTAQATIEQLLGLLDGVSTFGTAQGQASRLGLMSALQSLIIPIIDDIIYVVFALWLGVILLRSKWRTNPMSPIMACFLGGCVFWLLLLVFTFTHNLFRMINLNFIMIFSVPLVGYLLFSLKTMGRKRAARLVTMLIAFCLIATVFTTYQDPAEMFPNGSVTESEIVGSNWFITTRGEDIDIFLLQTAPWRYADMIQSNLFNENNPDIRWNSSESTSHFESFINANDTEGTDYLVYATYDRVVYTRTWESTGKYDQNDFISLNHLTTVDHIYTNGCLTVYSKP